VNKVMLHNISGFTRDVSHGNKAIKLSWRLCFLCYVKIIKKLFFINNRTFLL